MITGLFLFSKDNLLFKKCLKDLEAEKLELVHRCLKFILDSRIAKEAFAQIIDGEPTYTSFEKNYVHTFDDPPMHEQPTEMSCSIYCQIKDLVAAEKFYVSAGLFEAMQSAPRNTRQENLRLMELVSALVHSFAGMVFLQFHPETNLKPPNHDLEAKFYLTARYWVDFYHTNFKRYWMYPHGLLNVVGYWVETQLLGGVLLFERGPQGTENTNVFLQPPANPAAYRLSEEQISSFASTGMLPESIEGRKPQYHFTEFEDSVGVHSQQMLELNIYKNLYDRPRAMRMPRIPQRQCVVASNRPRRRRNNQEIESMIPHLNHVIIKRRHQEIKERDEDNNDNRDKDRAKDENEDESSDTSRHKYRRYSRSCRRSWHSEDSSSDDGEEDCKAKMDSLKV